MGTYTASKGSANERTVLLPTALTAYAGAVASARSNGFIAHTVGTAQENTAITIRLYNATAASSNCAGFFWNLIGY